MRTKFNFDFVYFEIITLSYNQLSHQRTSYNTMDMLGDLGGITEVLNILFSLLLWGYPKFSYGMKTLEKLYIAKTKEAGIIER